MKKFKGLLLISLLVIMSVTVMACTPKEPDPPDPPERSTYAADFLAAANSLFTTELSALTLSAEATVTGVENKYKLVPVAEQSDTDVAAAKAKLDTYTKKIADLNTEKAAADAKAFIDAVDALPAAADFTLDKKADYTAADTLYKALSVAAKAVTGVDAAKSKLDAVALAITGLEAVALINSQRETAKAPIIAAYNTDPKADYFLADWEAMDAIYKDAIAALDKLNTTAEITNYSTTMAPGVIQQIKDVQTIAQKVGVALNVKLDEIKGLQALYLEANYAPSELGSAAGWGAIQKLFADAIADVRAKESVEAIEAVDLYATGGLKDSLDAIGAYGAFKGEGSLAFANAQISVNAGNMLMGNGGAGNFFAEYDDVESLLVTVYAYKLDEETLTYGAGTYIGQSTLTWEWINRDSNSVPGQVIIGQPDNTNDGKLFYTNAAGEKTQIYGATAGALYTAISLNAKDFLQGVLGANYKEDGSMKYGITATVVTKVTATVGCSVPSVQKTNADNAAWGVTDGRIVAATSGFKTLVDAIGSVENMAYTQAKLDLILAAEAAYEAFAENATQRNFAAENFARLEDLRDKFNRLEEDKVDLFFAIIESIEADTAGINATTLETVVAEFVSKLRDAEARYAAEFLVSTTESEAYEEGFAGVAAIFAAANAAIATTSITPERMKVLEFLNAVAVLPDVTTMTLAQANAANAKEKILAASVLYTALPAADRATGTEARIAYDTGVTPKYNRYVDLYTAGLPQLTYANAGMPGNIQGGVTPGACFNDVRRQLANLGLTTNDAAGNGAVSQYVVLRIYFFTSQSNMTPSAAVGYIERIGDVGGNWSGANIKAAMTAKGISITQNYSCLAQWADRASAEGNNDPLARKFKDSLLSTATWIPYNA